MRPDSSIREVGEQLRSRHVTARSLTEQALTAVDRINPTISAFVAVDRRQALEAADTVDEAIRKGRDLGPLMGIPVAIKDIIDVAGLPTRCGSATYPDSAVARDATVVKRLRVGGAVVLGKTTVHELACGIHSAPASNPWDPKRIPGGSSGGSAGAVAAGVVLVALGSDTGGSIRIPAALCGIVGMKPTYERVSRSGAETLSWTLDHLGPLASSVRDCALTMNVIANHGNGIDFEESITAGVDGFRVGVSGNHFLEPAQADVVACFEEGLEQLRQLGAELIPVEIPELQHTVAAEFGIVGPEAAAFHRQRLRSHPHLIDPGIRALLVAGTLLPASQYLRALQARAVISASMWRTFEEHRLDVLVTPTLPATAALKDQPAFDYGQVSEDVIISYVRTTAPFNLTGQPALSVPCGFDAAGLPVGLQIAGRPFREVDVLRVGFAYEQSTDWHRRVPPVHAQAA